MPDWLSEDFLHRHGLPVAVSLALILVVSLMVLLFLPEHTSVGLWVAIGLGGIPIGYLTPREAIDHRGTNGSVILVGCWMTAIVLSRHIIGTYIFVEDWVFSMLKFNIISGFSLVSGILLGSFMHTHAEQLAKISQSQPSKPKSAGKSPAPVVQRSAWAQRPPASPDDTGSDFHQTKDSSPPEN